MGLPFLRTHIEHEALESTSDLARELALNAELACPALVLAHRQTRGRGRGTNAWWSDEGSLTVTLVLDPHEHGLRPEHQPRTALAVAVAVVDAVEALTRTTVPLGIRWPNDVEAGGRKLAGILPERIETPDGPRLLIGLGINVSTRLDEAPAEVRRMATTLWELAQPDASRPDKPSVLQGVLAQLPGVIERLSGEDPALAARWSRLDTLHGTTVRLNLGTRVVQRLATGIDPEGALLVSNGDQIERHFGGQVLRDV